MLEEILDKISNQKDFRDPGGINFRFLGSRAKEHASYLMASFDDKDVASSLYYIAEYEKESKRVQPYGDRPWWRVEVTKLSKDKSLSISLKKSVLATLKDLGGNYAKEADEMGNKRMLGIMESDIATIEAGNPSSKRIALVKLNEKYQETEKKFQQDPTDKNTMVELWH